MLCLLFLTEHPTLDLGTNRSAKLGKGNLFLNRLPGSIALKPTDLDKYQVGAIVKLSVPAKVDRLITRPLTFTSCDAVCEAGLRE